MQGAFFVTLCVLIFAFSVAPAYPLDKVLFNRPTFTENDVAAYLLQGVRILLPMQPDGRSILRAVQKV